MQSKTRNISLDIYRFLCMFLITAIHSFGYSKLVHALSVDHYNFHIVNGLYALLGFSITGFTLISAYFLVNTRDTLKKIITFWVQLLFFSIAILVARCIITPSVFSFKLLIKSLFPVLTYHYWYPVYYLILLLFAPILNKIIRRLSKKEHLSLILLLTFFVSFFFHFNPFYDPYVFVGHYSHSLLWLFLLYLIASYIRLYGVARPILFGPVAFCVSAVLLFLAYASGRVAAKSGGEMSLLLTIYDHVDLRSYNSLLPLILSVSSFITFLNLKIPSGKRMGRIASLLAPTIFGIYLIQEHNGVRSYLWKFVNLTRWAQSPWMLPVTILVFLALWGGSILVYTLYRLAHKLFLHKLEDALLRLTRQIIAYAQQRVHLN